MYPNINKMRSFIAVAEHGSFRKAAETLNLSQPALSAHVRGLMAVAGGSFHTAANKNLSWASPHLSVLERIRFGMDLEAWPRVEFSGIWYPSKGPVTERRSKSEVSD